MQQDKIRKPSKRPGSGGSLALSDLTGEVPEVEGVLNQVDSAIERAKAVKKKLQQQQEKKRRERSCGC